MCLKFVLELFRVHLTRTLFEQHLFRSQSVGDITEQMNLSNLNRELRFEELRKMREQMKENEEQWQSVSIKIHGFVTYDVCGVDVFILGKVLLHHRFVIKLI